MEFVRQEDVDKAISAARARGVGSLVLLGEGSKLLDEVQFKRLLSELENPVLAQRQLAVRIKVFIDAHIDEELKSYGKLSEYTRRWVKEYNEILDRLLKNTYGEKSISLHIHKVSHSDIAQKIRKYKSQSGDSDVLDSKMEISVEAEEVLSPGKQSAAKPEENKNGEDNAQNNIS